MSISQKQRQEQSVEVEATGEADITVEAEQVSHHAVGPVEETGDEVVEVDMNKVRERIEEHREVFVLVGLPGAGKSTVADIIAEEHDEKVTAFEVSGFVRTKFNEEHDEGVSDNELGAWAAEQKDKEGQDYFVREMAETIKDPSCPHVVISGVRSPEEAAAVEDVFGADSVTTIGVWTLPDIRFERKYGDTPSVEHDDWETFTERNERELWDWGAVEFFASDSLHEADYIIPNHDDIETLREHVQQFLNGVGQYDKNPFPHDDYATVAQYL